MVSSSPPGSVVAQGLSEVNGEGSSLFAWLEPLGWFLAGFLVVAAVGRFFVVPAIVRVIGSRNRNNPTITQATERYVGLFVLVVAAIAGLDLAGYGPALTRSGVFVGALTLAIGIAGRDVIGNVVSGLFLVADRNFNVGDWVRWGDSEGVVEAVSFRVTRIRSPDNESITVPNTELATTALTNPYSGSRYRVTEDIGVAYDDDLDAAVETLVEAARTTPEVLVAPSPTVQFLRFGEATVELRVRYWIADPTRKELAEVRLAYARRAKKLFDERGFSMSPPADHLLSGSLDVTGPGVDAGPRTEHSSN
ncbi:mechanosensitive ion channel family protein [Haloferacaceae archaeon DSL9]